MSIEPSDDFDRAKVLARLKKCLILANNEGATEGERDTAMKHAHAILAKYNLSIAEAEAIAMSCAVMLKQ